MRWESLDARQVLRLYVIERVRRATPAPPRLEARVDGGALRVANAEDRWATLLGLVTGVAPEGIAVVEVKVFGVAEIRAMKRVDREVRTYLDNADELGWGRIAPPEAYEQGGRTLRDDEVAALLGPPWTQAKVTAAERAAEGIVDDRLFRLKTREIADGKKREEDDLLARMIALGARRRTA